LISSGTLAATSVVTRELGTFVLRGKTAPVTVHEPIGAERQESEADDLGRFEAALAAFRRGAWLDAEQLFGALAARAVADGPSRYYHGLALRYRAEPPSVWRGAINVADK
jgi:hypothetical protein